MKIEIYRTDELPSDLRKEISGWDASIFEVEGSLLTWETEREWTLVVREGESPVSVITLLARMIQVGDIQVVVGGVGGVMTLPQYRGRGYAPAAMQKAVEFLCEKVPFGLLVCKPELEPFYAKLGWQTVNQPIVYDQPDGKKHTFPRETSVMIYACTDIPWPDGAIDLCGLPW